MRILTIKFSISNLIQISAFILLAYIFMKSSQILLVTLFSVIFAYILNPIVELLTKRMPRIAATGIVVLVAILLIVTTALWVIPEVYKDIELLTKNMNVYVNWIILKLTDIAKHIDIDIGADTLNELINWLKAEFSKEAGQESNMYNYLVEWGKKSSGILGKWMSGMAGSVPYAISITMNIILFPVIIAIILGDFPRLGRFVVKYAGADEDNGLRRYLNIFSEVMASYFRGQFIVMFILCILYSIALKIVGLDSWLLVGLLTGALSIVPYLGFTIGSVLSIIIAAIQFQDVKHIVFVIIGYAVVQVIDTFYVTPKIMGDSIGIHPLGTIVLLLVGGSAFGILGMILILPMAMILFQIYKERYSLLLNPNFVDYPLDDDYIELTDEDTKKTK